MMWEERGSRCGGRRRGDVDEAGGSLALPIFLVDPVGTLIIYNEPAEGLLGQRYDETGDMPLEERGTNVPADRGHQAGSRRVAFGRRCG
jgi:hypothetical protein